MLARFSATSTSSLLRRSSRAVSVAPRRAFPPLRRARVPPSPVRARPLVAMASAGARLDKVATPGATAVADVSATGAFVRKDSVFRNRIEKDGAFPPEAGRYHVYVSLACPWACRVVSVIGLKGLGDAVSWSSVHPTWQRTRAADAEDTHAGWAFAAEGQALASPSGCGSFAGSNYQRDPLHPLDEIRFVRDLYDRVGANDGTRFTVPILWDKKTDTIVSNESSEIIRDLNVEFNAFATNPDLDLYPVASRAAIDAANEWIYHGVNNGVYKCGFATTQAAYDEAVTELFVCLDRIEHMLGNSRFIAGPVLTEADVRLFPTLARFDEVYVVYFKTNKKALREYPNISGYIRDVYQTEGVKASVDMWHIKTHYFTSHPVLNANAVVPVGSGWDFDAPHGRDGAYPR